MLISHILVVKFLCWNQRTFAAGPWTTVTSKATTGKIPRYQSKDGFVFFKKYWRNFYLLWSFYSIVWVFMLVSLPLLQTFLELVFCGCPKILQVILWFSWMVPKIPFLRVDLISEKWPALFWVMRRVVQLIKTILDQKYGKLNACKDITK